MIKSIHFQNFKALRDATLPLGAFTLILGPNGSGKSTAMQALHFASDPGSYDFDNIVTAGWEGDPTVDVSIEWTWEGEKSTTSSHLMFKRPAGPTPQGNGSFPDFLKKALASFKVYSFEAQSLSRPVETNGKAELSQDGS